MHRPSLSIHSVSRPWTTNLIKPNTESIFNSNGCRRKSSSFIPGSLLRHEHLRSDRPDGLVDYETAERHQEEWRAKHLDWKAQRATTNTAQDSDHPSAPPPPPVLLSFESKPIYTFGRQQQKLPLGGNSEELLRQRLHVRLPQRKVPIEETFVPGAKQTNRGGLTTYHGPGQLVLWPILDLHSPLYAHFTASSYASHLEHTTQTLLLHAFGIVTTISPTEPGVWVPESAPIDPRGRTIPPRKIAAVGVHHRRYVAGLGTAINIDTRTAGGDADTNPWARFVPCGIEGKAVTSVAEELRLRDLQGELSGLGVGYDLEGLARWWADIFEKGLLDPAKRKTDPRR